jgi:D-glucosaminate-6-phosphate ammonia-lyase
MYERLGIRAVINGAGYFTRLGGSLMDDTVLDAMREAAREFVPIDELQGVASRTIAEITGAEAGLVTCGAAAALLLGTAACMTGLDPDKMDRLPITEGMKNEVVIQRSQRNGYDHPVRATGAHLVEIGMSNGARRYELERALTDRTAAVFYGVAASRGLPLALEEAVEIAHSAGVPVLVDAAGELPPAENLRRFVSQGADLVAFSGGKAIRGPQASGILCGRRALIEAAAWQMLDMAVDWKTWRLSGTLAATPGTFEAPEQGIGRALKAGKEEIVGLITALQAYSRRDHGADLKRWTEAARNISTRLSGAGLDARVVTETESGFGVPIVSLRLPGGSRAGRELTTQLRGLDPPLYLDEEEINRGVLIVNPSTLKPGEDAVLTESIGSVWRSMTKSR